MAVKARNKEPPFSKGRATQGVFATPALSLRRTLNEEDNAQVRQEVETRLSRLVTPEAAERWLNSPHDFLQGATPREAIERGEGERVQEAVGTLEWGHYA